jgi:uncharacterized protein (DUF697 family)
MKKSEFKNTTEIGSMESQHGEPTANETMVESSSQDETLSSAERLSAAESIVLNHSYVAAGFGFIPVPIVDFVGLTATQIKLLKSLGDLYGVKYVDGYIKNTVAALINGYAPLQFAPLLASVIKSVPIIGQSAGALSMAALGGGMTYAIGKVFVQHFESGGTFLTFDPKKVSDYFKSQFKVGAKLAVKPATASVAPAAPVATTA